MVSFSQEPQKFGKRGTKRFSKYNGIDSIDFKEFKCASNQKSNKKRTYL